MIQVTCPSCNACLRIVDKYAGKKVRCPECRQAIRLMLTSPEKRDERPRPRQRGSARDDGQLVMHLRVAHQVGKETPADTLDMLAHEARTATRRHHHAH